MNQKKIISYFFIAAIVFLFANILADKFLTGNDTKPAGKITAAGVNSKFIAAVKSFGIDESWIKRKKAGKNHPSPADNAYIVNVPQDLPVALIIKEITNRFSTDSISIRAEEKKGGNTLLKIIDDKVIRLSADFTYNKDIRRKAGYLAFLLNGFDELGGKEDSVLLNSPESFAVIVSPSKASVDFVKKINAAGKEYVLLLNDDTDELKYKLSPRYSVPRLKSSVRSILADFGNAAFLLVDDNSSVSGTQIYPLLKEEMDKRKIKLLRISSFHMISSDDPALNLKNFISGINDGEKKIVRMSAEDYISSSTVLESSRKTGTRFINPSEVIFSSY